MCGRIRRFSLLIVLTAVVGFDGIAPAAADASPAAQSTIAVLSAASFDAASITPAGIVAAFGSSLATMTAIPTTPPLPTQLAGTTARIRDSANVERLAELFFVSMNQVNLLVPAETALGAATITIRSGDGTTSTGSFEVVSIAPAVFTANANGSGVPAANLIRVKTNGAQTLESPFVFGSGGVLQPRPINLGPEGERVFLILFLTGIRRAADPNSDGNLNESIGVAIAGDATTPAFAGVQGIFVGLDQVNLELPRALVGRGRINLSVTAGGSASNPVEIEIAASAGTGLTMVNSFTPGTVLAGESMRVQGSGFDPDGAGNLVRIGGVEAVVTAASMTELDVAVPFGAATGAVSVATAQGSGGSEQSVNVRTSISGLIESTDRQPLPGVAVKVRGTSISATTGVDGVFLLPDTAAGTVLLEVDASTVETIPTFDKVLLKMPVTAARDNPYPTAVPMQQATGASVTVGDPGGFSGANRTDAAPGVNIQTGAIRFDLDANAAALFADGSRRGVLTLSVLGNDRAPAALPPGQFSAAIAQLAPLGVKLTPGGRLSFPNTELLPPNSTATLFKLDQDPASRTVGSFIAFGSATVGANGLRIETESGAITESGIYFVSVKQQTTTIVGRVLDNDAKTPVRFALVRARNQEATTDGNGGFILRNVPVRAGAEQILIEASFVRPNRRVDRVFRAGVVPVVNGTTVVKPDLVLPSATSNRPPVVLAPNLLTVARGDRRAFNVLVIDPDQNPITQVEVSGGAFATIVPHPTLPNVYLLGIAPGPNDAVDTYMLTIRATDSLNAATSQIVVVQVTAGQ